MAGPSACRSPEVGADVVGSGLRARAVSGSGRLSCAISRLGRPARGYFQVGASASPGRGDEGAVIPRSGRLGGGYRRIGVTGSPGNLQVGASDPRYHQIGTSLSTSQPGRDGKELSTARQGASASTHLCRPSRSLRKWKAVRVRYSHATHRQSRQGATLVSNAGPPWSATRVSHRQY